MSILYKGYCPSCDEGLSWQNQDIKYISGTKYIVCPNCGFNIVIPAMDINKNGIVERDEYRKISFENPNFVSIEGSEEESGGGGSDAGSSSVVGTAIVGTSVVGGGQS